MQHPIIWYAAVGSHNCAELVCTCLKTDVLKIQTRTARVACHSNLHEAYRLLPDVAELVLKCCHGSSIPSLVTAKATWEMLCNLQPAARQRNEEANECAATSLRWSGCQIQVYFMCTAVRQCMPMLAVHRHDLSWQPVSSSMLRRLPHLFGRSVVRS